mmetsp:Transcript_70475/g.106584  ORF Transcript_70475/g.106584 Transcript_70475/m.106584 type:complete len:98 (-) Transcript_70475:273-566(-)
MRGLPYSCTEEEIYNFFYGYRVAKNGLKRSVKGGRPSGEAFVLFETKDEGERAMGLNMEKIGSRFIELFSANTREYESYLVHNYNSSQPSYNKDNMP